MKINEENQSEWVERYLEHTLNHQERQFFEEKLGQDRALKTELETQQEAHRWITSTLHEEKYRRQIHHILEKNPDLIGPDGSRGGDFFWQQPGRWIMAISLFVLVGLALYWLNSPPAPMSSAEENLSPADTNQEQIAASSEPETLSQDNSPTLEAQSRDTAQPANLQPKNSENQQAQAPQLFMIPEYIYKQSMGFSGSDQAASRQRPVLRYYQAPVPEAQTQGQTYYLLEDTLHVYGDVQIQNLKLLFLEPDLRYLWAEGGDTIEIFQDTDWRRLERP